MRDFDSLIPQGPDEDSQQQAPGGGSGAEEQWEEREELPGAD